MMRRHHENRMKFDFPRDGKQNQFAFLTKTIPSRSNRKAVTLSPYYSNERSQRQATYARTGLLNLHLTSNANCVQAQPA